MPFDDAVAAFCCYRCRCSATRRTEFLANPSCKCVMALGPALLYGCMWASVCVMVTTSFLHFLKSLFFLLSSSRCLDGLLFRFLSSCLYAPCVCARFQFSIFRFIFHSNAMRISWRVCKPVTIQYIGNIDFNSRKKIHLKLLETTSTPVIINRKSLNILFDYRFEMITVHGKTAHRLGVAYRKQRRNTRKANDKTFIKRH